MKSTTLTVLLGLSLTLGAALTSRAENQQTIRIPQGRGQFIEIPATRSASAALFVAGSKGSTKANAEFASSSYNRPCHQCARLACNVL